MGTIGSLIEAVYAEETNLYVDAALGREPWPADSVLRQQRCSAALAAAEKSFATRQWLKIDPRLEPAPELPRR